MSISARGQFKCHACGEKGSVFDFYSKRHGVDFSRALREVARFAPGFDTNELKMKPRERTAKQFDSSLIGKWVENLRNSPEAMLYLTNRGLTEETVAAFRLGWTGDRISIPIRDVGGAVVNAKLYKPGGNANDKMIWAVAGTKAPLFIPPAELAGAGAVLMVEGEFDCMIARQHGFNANSGTAGAMTWKPEWTEQLKGLVVYFLYDRDDKGEKGALAASKHLIAAGLETYVGVWPDGEPDGFDMTDWFVRVGGSEDGLRKILDAAVPYVAPHIAESNGHTIAPMVAERLPLMRLSDVEREEVQWLWHPYIPRGKLSLLVGNPGVGKSFLSAALTASITNGWRLPGQDEPLDIAEVILLAAEDGPADTLRPRLEDMGAHEGLRHVMVLPPEENFSLLADMERLEHEIVERKPALVIIDPLTAYLGGKTDMYRDNEVRAALGPLVQLAAQHGTAILGVMHLTKGSRDVLLHKVLGSVGFTGLARSVLAVAPDPQNAGRKVMAPLKSNLAREGEARAFSIEEGKFVWGLEAVDIDLETLFAPQQGNGGEKKDDERISQAIDFLKSLLDSGQPIPTAKLFEAGKANGFTERMMKRAKGNIVGLRSRKLIDGWCWQVPKIGVVEDVVDDPPWWNN